METKVFRRVEAPAVMTERRAVLRVLQHWRKIGGKRDFPSRADIDPVAIASDWKNCFIVDLFGSRGVPSFGYIGQALRIPAWGDGLGARITDCPPGTVLAVATNYIDKVIENRLPVSHSGSAMHGGHAVLFRSILLPLSADGARIDALLGTANFRRVEQDRLVIIDED
jgi:hypothetical protein